MGILFSDSLTDSQKQAIQNTFQQFQHPSLQKDSRQPKCYQKN